MKVLLCVLAAALCGIVPVAYGQTIVVLPFNTVEDLDRCVRDNSRSVDICNDRLADLVKATPSLAFAAGKRARLKFNSQFALPYFDMAARSEPAQKICADEDVHLAVIAGLGLPVQHAFQATATRLFNQCYSAILPKVQAKLVTNQGGHFWKNTCAILASNKVLDANCTPKTAVAAESTPAIKPLPKLGPDTQLERVRTYRGPEGELVSIAFVKGQAELAVVYFKHIMGDWNNQARAHRFVDLDNDSGDFYIVRDARAWNSVVKRNGSYQIYTPGQPPFYVGYSEKDSQAVSAQILLEALR